MVTSGSSLSKINHEDYSCESGFYCVYKFENGNVSLLEKHLIEEKEDTDRIEKLILLAREKKKRINEGKASFITTMGGCGSIPTDYCTITQNTVFEPGTYNLPHGISINADNVSLDCNGAVLRGSADQGIGEGGIDMFVDNVEVKNCVIQNFGNGMFVLGSNNKFINNDLSSNLDSGIFFVDAVSNNITGNTFHSNKNGVNINGNSKSILLTGNVFFDNERGIYISQPSQDTKLLGNDICKSSYLDIFPTNSTAKRYGDENSCDKPGLFIWRWDDTGTVGCSYTCSNEACDKLEPASKKGFRLLNNPDDNWRVDFLGWVKDSKHSEYNLCTPFNFDMNISYESSVEYELNVSVGKDKLRIAYTYLLSGGQENSVYFSTKVFIYNFGRGVWEGVYDKPRNGGVSTEDVVDIYLSKERIQNGKIRLRAVQKNIDVNESAGSCSVVFLGGEQWSGTISLDRFTHQFCSSNIAPPLFSNLPDKNISQDSKPPARWIDLWNYVSDQDTPKEKLKFSVESQSNSNLINCWIDVNRYITCDAPTKGQTGYSDITIEVKDPQGLSDTDTFSINILPPTLTVLIIPFDWNASYQTYSETVEVIASYFLKRIPLSNCSGQFKLIKVKENEDYGRWNWLEWRCKTEWTYYPFDQDCFYEFSTKNKTLGGALRRIYNCAEEYTKSKDEKYDFVVGISNNDIGVMEGLFSCNKNVDGWSDGEGKLPSVIAETGSVGIVTHELGHEFSLSDQYCNCDGTSSEKFCGTNVKYSSLKFQLGCNPNEGQGCCWWSSDEVYPGCHIWCDGNFDRFGEDRNNDTWLDYGQRTTMSNLILQGQTGHYDKYEFIHLQNLPSLQCKTEQLMNLLKMQKLEATLEPDFNLQIMLGIDKKDNITLLELNFTELEPFETESSGEYSLKILDQSNNTLYQKNFSVDFIIFSDPPTFVNESIIFEIVQYQDSMKKLEVYHNDSLIFSHDIPAFCNSNDICEENENYISCPSDCKSNALDSICNREKGDGCDLDCISGVDPDCNDLFLAISISNTTPVSNDLIFIKTNISNIGAHNFSNVIIEFTVDGNSIENKSFSIIANSSLEAIFQWKAQFGIHNLYFSVDSNNLINEINETNNEQKSEINVSKIRIPLYSGWNLISIPLNLSNKTINYLFNNIVPIFGYKNNSFFVPDEIDTKLGYWLKINESKNLTLIGTEIENPTIELNEGWNLISYPSLNEMNTSDIVDYLNLIMVYAYNGSWSSYIPNRSFNSLEILKPGYGYWVYVH